MTIKIGKNSIVSVLALLIVTLLAFFAQKFTDASQNIPKATPNGLFLVSRVVDGDTVELDNGEKVRYIGINTPETTMGKDECYGRDATDKNKELVEGKNVRLVRDVSETDKYGRLLRYVYLPATDSQPEIFVNDYLVRQGYANVDTFPPDVKYSEQFTLAAREARDNGRGFWSGCSEPAKGDNLDTVEGMSTEDKDCKDFETQAEAQDYFIAQGGPEKDPSHLDGDHDGKVCVSLP